MEISGKTLITPFVNVLIDHFLKTGVERSRMIPQLRTDIYSILQTLRWFLYFETNTLATP